MLRHLKSSLWSFLSIFIRTIGSLGINKLIALYYGPNGITLYAHFQNLIAIVTTVPNGGINVGAIKFLATEEPASTRYRQYLWAGIWLNLLCVVVSLTVIFALPGYFLDAFLEEAGLGEVWWWVLVFGLGSLLLTYNLYCQSLLLSKQVLNWYVLGVSCMSLSGLLVVWLLGGKLTASALMPAILGAQSLSFFLMLPILAAKKFVLSLRPEPVPRAVYRDVVKFILMALSAVVCLKLTDFLVRDFLINRFDLYETGLWQAVVRVSENYMLVYSAVVGMVVYPRMAALANAPQQLRLFVRAAFYVVLPLLAVSLSLLYVLREWVLLLLFSQNFVVAAYLFDYQLLGDFFKMWSIVLTSILVVQVNVRLYVVWQVVSALFYVLLVSLLVTPYGLEGVTMAHAIRYGATLLFFMVYYYRYIRP